MEFQTFGKRPAEDFLENQAKRQAGFFRGLPRQTYIQQRIHRRLHAQVTQLSDADVQSLGELSFHQQFPAMEQMSPAANAAASPGGAGEGENRDSFFPQVGFDGYLRQTVHPKLHAIAEKFAPEKLLELGRMTFQEQFASMDLPCPEDATLQAAPKSAATPPSSLFGAIGRSGFLHQNIHKKLHPLCIPLSDKDLFDLGKLSFNEQFGMMGLEGLQAGEDSGLFDELGREGYLQRHVHRKLHGQALCLSDEDLFNLGKLGFNAQFAAIEASLQETTRSTNSVFGLQDRDTYIQTRVHRKLHSHTTSMSDEEVFQLGKLCFNEQFQAVGVEGSAGQMDPSIFLEQPPLTPAPGAPSLFGNQDRNAYVQTRVHRKLHMHVNGMSDEEVLRLGQLSFNEQFRAVGVDGGPPPLSGQPAEHGVSLSPQEREAFVQAHIHRKLHIYIPGMVDEDVMQLGKQSFNEQFRMLGVDMNSSPAVTMPAVAPPVHGMLLRGLPRQEYMQQRIHRKLHPQAAYLSDQDLNNIGELSFVDQFGALEKAKGAKGGGKGGGPAPGEGFGMTASTLFGGLDRTSFMMQRVHRKLHGRAAQLSDEDLVKLGTLSFNEQFPTLERLDGLQTVTA